MRLKSIRNCRSGETLARSIYTETGMVLVGAGVVLTDRMIARLKEKNITSLYIMDSRTDDIVVDTVISEETRREAMSLIHETFQAVGDTSSKKWKNVFADKLFGRELRQVMSAIADEVKNCRSAMNLMADACAYDNYIFSHSFNVALYSTAIAMKTGFSEKEVLEIGTGGLLHDIGKTCVPDEILQKPGRLDPDEFELMKKHAEQGFEMLRKLDDISLVVAHCAYQHHERWDGSGYPRGLKGEDIHPYARLMAVADVFDALTTHRVYRSSVLPHVAMEILYSGSNTMFDPTYVIAMRDTIALYPVGLSVTLNTGESGVVIGGNAGLPSRPIIRILFDESGQQVDKPYEYDLGKRLDLMIVACDELM